MSEMTNLLLGEEAAEEIAAVKAAQEVKEVVEETVEELMEGAVGGAGPGLSLLVWVVLVIGVSFSVYALYRL